VNGILFAIIKNDNEMLKQSHAHQVISKVVYMRCTYAFDVSFFSLKPGTKRIIMDGLSERVCLQVLPWGGPILLMILRQLSLKKCVVFGLILWIRESESRERGKESEAGTRISKGIA